MTYRKTEYVADGAFVTPSEPTVVQQEPTTDELADDLLKQAASLIEKEGWTRGRLHRDGEGYCAVGALQASFGRNTMKRYNSPVYGRALTRLASEVAPCRTARRAAFISLEMVVQCWNDNQRSLLKRRDKRRVIQALRNA